MKDWVSGTNRLRGSKNRASYFAAHVQKRILTCLEKQSAGRKGQAAKTEVHLLDYGCGDCALTGCIDIRQAKISACDITDAYISEQDKRKFSFTLVQDLLSSADGEKFDVVYSFGVVQYLTGRELEVLNLELRKHLKKDGVIVHCNILDIKKLFEYYKKPTGLWTGLKFIIGGGLRSLLTKEIWADGSRWHDVANLAAATGFRVEILQGYSPERTDLVFWCT